MSAVDDGYLQQLPGDWGQVLLVAIGKPHTPRAKPHSESRQASGKT